MFRMAKWAVALTVVALLAAPALAADALTQGEIKSVDAAKNEFTVTASGKDYNMKAGDLFMVSRGGKEASLKDLKAGDKVAVCFDQGVTANTAHFILVQDDASRDLTLGRGKVKAWDDKKNEMVLTDLNNKDWTFDVGPTATVMVGREKGKMADIKVNEPVAIVYEKKGDKLNAHEVIALRPNK